MCKNFNKSRNNIESYDAHFKTCINIEDGPAITSQPSEHWLVTRMKISLATIKQPQLLLTHSMNGCLLLLSLSYTGETVSVAISLSQACIIT
jgi:hypothetical protein